MLDIERFFRAVITQNADAMRACFDPEAWVEWPCSNEHFELEEYIRANCEYPGDWCGEIERCEQLQDGVVMAAGVWPKDESAHFHVVSFIKLLDDKITSMVEYWADDDSAPEWRREMKIGKPIKVRGE